MIYWNVSKAPVSLGGTRIEPGELVRVPAHLQVEAAALILRGALSTTPIEAAAESTAPTVPSPPVESTAPAETEPTDSEPSPWSSGRESRRRRG